MLMICFVNGLISALWSLACGATLLSAAVYDDDIHVVLKSKTSTSAAKMGFPVSAENESFNLVSPPRANLHDESANLRIDVPLCPHLLLGVPGRSIHKTETQAAESCSSLVTCAQSTAKEQPLVGGANCNPLLPCKLDI